jgi:ComF family protein
VLERFFGLFLATTCALCDRPASPGSCLCQDCQQQLLDCRWEGRSQQDAGPKASDSLPVVSWGKYGGGLKRAIARLKYDGHRALADPLGIWLAERWLASEGQTRQTHHSPLVVPIPLYSEKQQQRGFNQADLIAASFCRRARLPLRKAGLVRTRATAPQFSLSPSARQDNLKQAFALGPDLQPRPLRPCGHRPLLLLDDIYTTGATIQAARAELEAAGWVVRGVVAVARAGRSGGNGAGT